MGKESQLDLFRENAGGSLVELALLMPVFLVLLVGAIDLGRAYYLSIEVAGAAHAAATYGSQHPTDTAGMTTAAQDDAPNVPNLLVGSPTYGCECSDGSNYSASCSSTPSCPSNTEVYRVNVTVTATYTPLFPWPGIPSSLSLSSSASMRSAGG